MKNYRIRQTKTKEYVYKEKFIDKFYNTYKKRLKESESNGTAFNKLTKQEFRKAINNALDDRMTGIEYEKYSKYTLTEVVVKKSIILESKRAQNRVKKLDKNIDLTKFYGQYAKNVVADWIDNGIFKNSKEVDEYLY